MLLRLNTLSITRKGKIFISESDQSTFYDSNFQPIKNLEMVKNSISESDQ